jgi:hypothetical protein
MRQSNESLGFRVAELEAHVSELEAVKSDMRCMFNILVSAQLVNGQQIHADDTSGGIFTYDAQPLIGQSLLRRACLVGTMHRETVSVSETRKRALTAAAAQSRALVFDIGTTTPFLNDEFQDLRFVITERVVTELPLNSWCSIASAALPSQYASAAVCRGNTSWAYITNMRITAVHELGDNDPAMAEALRQLAALASATVSILLATTRKEVCGA